MVHGGCAWTMYTDLNKTCPKDEYPLLRIDQIVDSTFKCELLCLLDDYSGYHQIGMCIDDEKKTMRTECDVALCIVLVIMSSTLSYCSPRKYITSFVLTIIPLMLGL